MNTCADTRITQRWVAYGHMYSPHAGQNQTGIMVARPRSAQPTEEALMMRLTSRFVRGLAGVRHPSMDAAIANEVLPVAASVSSTSSRPTNEHLHHYPHCLGDNEHAGSQHRKITSNLGSGLRTGIARVSISSTARSRRVFITHQHHPHTLTCADTHDTRLRGTAASVRAL